MAKSTPKLSRGYTRALDYLLDSDDDAPMPKWRVRTSADAGCISQPPHKPVNSAAAPMTKAVASASIAKLSITGQPKPPPKRPAVHMQPNTSYRPSVDVLAPKRAKGRWRDAEEMKHALESGGPPISTGYEQMHPHPDGALWRSVRISEKAKMRWPVWGRGVLDLRPCGRAPMVAGKLLRHAIDEARRIINMVPCEHKIGMCKCPYERFMMYQSDESEWQPWIMCLLGSPDNQEGSFFLEASLIYELERSNRNINTNMNKSCDDRGEHPRTDEDAEHFVYLAVAPIASAPKR